MYILIIILLIIAGVVALILIIALFMKKQHYVKREIIINAPQRKIFDFVKLLKNQDEFNKGAMEDANRKKEFKGIDGTVGYIYSWSGNKDAGVGEKEIIHIVEGKSIETEIRFEKPMKAVGRMIIDTESLPHDQTKVSWSNSGVLNYPLNIMVPMVEKHVVRDADMSLLALKNILEK